VDSGRQLRSVRVLAIDPGTIVAGYGVLEARGGGDPVLLECGCIRPPRKGSAPDKLLLIHKTIRELLGKWAPNVVALEDAFYHRNARSTLKLGEVLGVCRLAAAAAGVRVVSYAPRRVKKAVVGRGQADKIQVQGMVTLILGLSSPPDPLDISDALALGIACLHDLRLASLESSGG